MLESSSEARGHSRTKRSTLRSIDNANANGARQRAGLSARCPLRGQPRHSGPMLGRNRSGKAGAAPSEATPRRASRRVARRSSVPEALLSPRSLAELKTEVEAEAEAGGDALGALPVPTVCPPSSRRAGLAPPGHAKQRARWGLAATAIRTRQGQRGELPHTGHRRGAGLSQQPGQHAIGPHRAARASAAARFLFLLEPGPGSLLGAAGRQRQQERGEAQDWRHPRYPSARTSPPTPSTALADSRPRPFSRRTVTSLSVCVCCAPLSGASDSSGRAQCCREHTARHGLGSGARGAIWGGATFPRCNFRRCSPAIAQLQATLQPRLDGPLARLAVAAWRPVPARPARHCARTRARSS